MKHKSSLTKAAAPKPAGASKSGKHRVLLVDDHPMTLAGLADIVNEITGVAVADIASEKSFTDDLDIDSLSMVEVVMAAEEKFGVTIPDEEVKNLVTVGDAVSYIAKASA